MVVGLVSSDIFYKQRLFSKVENVKRIINSNKTLTFVGIAYFAFHVIDPKQQYFVCPFRRYFGFYCPGCGITRAIESLFRFQLSNALHENLLFFFLPLAIVLPKYIKYRRHRLAYFCLLFGCVLVFTVIRNQPNSPLAPI